MPVKSPCVKCELTNNSNGLFTCNGCQQSYCSNHILDHKNELRNRFDEISNQYNIVKYIFGDYEHRSRDPPSKIRQRKEEINKIKLEIDETQTIPNYSEMDLDKWMRQLEKLKEQLLKINQENLFIKSINFFITNLSWLLNYNELVYSLLILIFSALQLNQSAGKITFGEVNGPIQLLDNNRLAVYNGLDLIDGSVRVNQIYSAGVHHVRLSIEKLSPSSNAFIGIIDKTGKEIIPPSHGWFISNGQVISQKPGEYKFAQMVRKLWSALVSNQPGRDIEQGDRIDMEIDCLNSKIKLKNERTKKIFELDIDLKLSPLPWQIIIHLDRHGDRLRLLQ